MNVAVPHVVLPRSRRALILVGIALLAVLVVARVGGSMVTRSATPDEPTEKAQQIEVPAAPLTAHGLVQPVARANVTTIGGGSVIDLLVSVGQSVEKGQALARVAGPTQTEVVIAPLDGAVNAVNVHAGDGVPPGATLLTVADSSRYQVESVDVDEYLLARLRPRQGVTITFDSDPQRTLRGTVGSISPQAQTTPAGGLNYLTIVNLAGAEPNLRPGMTVHLVFDS
ncbi:MAG TPA: HlyD family efflux transporter periplasmic adaptor subunit [Chloroflexota bacterium]|jgi:multidrug resistance efflux pump|nr:HlyD family efflux transporter periplasmic adaptor subunit [Chloroflexota bacterium]